jgi:hypothetical protein
LLSRHVSRLGARLKGVTILRGHISNTSIHCLNQTGGLVRCDWELGPVIPTWRGSLLSRRARFQATGHTFHLNEFKLSVCAANSRLNQKQVRKPKLFLENCKGANSVPESGRFRGASRGSINGRRIMATTSTTVSVRTFGHRGHYRSKTCNGNVN